MSVSAKKLFLIGLSICLVTVLICFGALVFFQTKSTNIQGHRDVLKTIISNVIQIQSALAVLDKASTAYQRRAFSLGLNLSGDIERQSESNGFLELAEKARKLRASLSLVSNELQTQNVSEVADVITVQALLSISSIIDIANGLENKLAQQSDDILVSKNGLIYSCIVFLSATIIAIFSFLNRAFVEGILDINRQIRSGSLPIQLESRSVEVKEVQDLKLAFNELTENLNKTLLAANKLRSDAETASQSKTDFIANMSHELRTPLNAIMGFGQLLRMTAKDKLSQGDIEYLESIVNSGEDLLNLVEKILDFSAIQADQISLIPDRVLVLDALKTSIIAYENLAKEKNIEIEFDRASLSYAAIWTDENRFRQIFCNLMNNAISYTPENGSVNVFGEQDGDFFKISVEDDGIGLSEHAQLNMFGVFNRFSSDPLAPADGLGLSLAVSKQLVDRLGGRIGFDDKRPNGTKFWVAFPLESNDVQLIWTSDLRIGVDPIDADHQKVFNLINRINTSHMDREAIEEVVVEMINYTSYHFRREEEIMRISYYTDTTHHIQRHHKLEITLKEMFEEWRESGDIATLRKLSVFLRSWWLNHILNVDVTLVRFAKGKEDEIAARLRQIA